MSGAVCFAMLLFFIVAGTVGCGRRAEMQSSAQAPAAATTAETEPSDETPHRHIANLSIRRDERGHITGLFDVTSYYEDEQLCQVKQKVLKLIGRREERTGISDLIFEMPSTVHLYMPLEEKLQELYQGERNEFERFFRTGKKFRLTVYDCFAPCQNSQDVINIEPL